MNRGGPQPANLILLSEMQITQLVGGFNPLEKYWLKMGNLPQVGVKMKNLWNQHLVKLSPHLHPFCCILLSLIFLQTFGGVSPHPTRIQHFPRFPNGNQTRTCLTPNSSDIDAQAKGAHARIVRLHLFTVGVGWQIPSVNHHMGGPPKIMVGPQIIHFN